MYSLIYFYFFKSYKHDYSYLSVNRHNIPSRHALISIKQCLILFLLFVYLFICLLFVCLFTDQTGSLHVLMGSVLALSSRPGRQNSPFPQDRPLSRWDKRDGRLPNPGSFDGLHRSCKGETNPSETVTHF